MQKIFNFFYKHKLIISIITIVIVILFFLLWPKINIGTLSINTTDYPLTISYCQISTDNSNQDKIDCESTNDISTINISETNYNISLKPGTYHISVTKPNYQTMIQNFDINIRTTTLLNINLQPLGVTITDQLVHDYSFDPNTRAIYYLAEDLITDQNNQTKTQFSVTKKINDQSEELFKTTILSEIDKSSWSPDHNKIIVQAKEENENSKQYLINLIDHSITETKLPNLDIVWSSDSNHVYYIYIDKKQNQNEQKPDKIPTGGGFIPSTIYGTNNNAITIADPDGSNWQVINKLNNQYYDLTLSKSNDDQYFAITTANYEGFIINNSTATILQLNQEILYRRLSFSPNNTYLLAETIDADYHPSLQYSLLQNINFQPLNITTYLAKTTWLDDNNFVVAIPNTIPTTTFNDLLNTTDRIKQVNISENSFQILEWNINNQTSEGSYALSANSNYLYLLDKSNYLYFIPKTN